MPAQEKCQTAFCPVTEKRVMQNEASDVMQGTSKPTLEQLLSLDAWRLATAGLLRVATGVHWAHNTGDVFGNTKEALEDWKEGNVMRDTGSQVVRSFSTFSVSHTEYFGCNSNRKELKESRNFTLS